MTNLVLHRESTEQAIALPSPRRGPIAIRLATLDDIPFIDALQKQHTKMVGFFPRVWFEQNIETNNVLIAEELNHGGHGEHREGQNGSGRNASESTSNDSPSVSSVPSVVNTPLGYCVYKDKYLKRDELGIVYQLNVAPGRQRGLIGAALVKAAFERCPYGVKLFCCWCAQDIEANYFWESIGFVPIAFRTGSRRAGSKKEPRIHIYWQRRIREGDEATPYWFPSETSGGAVRENRLVLPIPPDTHWSDAKPSVLPGLAIASAGEGAKPLPLQPHPREKRERKTKAKSAVRGPQKPRGGLWFAPPEPPPLTKEEVKAAKEAEKKAKAEEKKRQRRTKQKNDPKYVAVARELRDRYLEDINSAGDGMLLPPAAHGKYDVSRQLPHGSFAPMLVQTDKLLDAA
jgi:hypothetical protein